MSSNSRGSMRPGHGSRTPSFILVGLLFVIVILGYNYWNATAKYAVLSQQFDEITDRHRKYSLSSEARYEELRQRFASNENEIATNKQTISQKGDEVNSLTVQLSDMQLKKNEFEVEREMCLSQLDSASTKQIACENLESSLRSEKAEKEEELAACQTDKQRKLEASKEECNRVGDAVRLNLLKTVQSLFGDNAIRTLLANGVNINGLVFSPTAAPEVVVALAVDDTPVPNRALAAADAAPAPAAAVVPADVAPAVVDVPAADNPAPQQVFDPPLLPSNGGAGASDASSDAGVQAPKGISEGAAPQGVIPGQASDAAPQGIVPPEVSDLNAAAEDLRERGPGVGDLEDEDLQLQFEAGEKTGVPSEDENHGGELEIRMDEAELEQDEEEEDEEEEDMAEDEREAEEADADDDQVADFDYPAPVVR